MARLARSGILPAYKWIILDKLRNFKQISSNKFFHKTSILDMLSKMENEGIDYEKLSIIELVSLIRALNTLSNGLKLNMREAAMKRILQIDFNTLSSDALLEIIKFGSFLNDNTKLLIDLKKKIMETDLTNLNIDQVKEFSIALVNLNKGMESDIILNKKLIDDNFYQINNHSSDKEIGIDNSIEANKKLTDLLTYLKKFQPIFYHFMDQEAYEILSTIAKNQIYNNNYKKAVSN